MSYFYQMPIYREEQLTKWQNIEIDQSTIQRKRVGFADLWVITKYPRPNGRRTSLLSVNV